MFLFWGKYRKTINRTIFAVVVVFYTDHHNFKSDCQIKILFSVDHHHLKLLQVFNLDFLLVVVNKLNESREFT